MLDPDLLRRDFASTAANLRRRGLSLDENEFNQLESRRRSAMKAAEDLRARRNQLAREIGRAKDSKNDADSDSNSSAAAEAAELKNHLHQADSEMREAQAAMESYLLRLPNVLDDSVPDGADESANEEIRRWGEPPKFDFAARDHAELGRGLGMMDFDRAAAMAAARFVALSDGLAKMHRALAQWMLDLHTGEHGYAEYYLPHLANPGAMQAAGQLPKFADEVFFAERDSLYLIPTAEVALVNLARDRIFASAELPLRVVAHTPCYRREAGSYGRDTRGMLRQHQFDKVELVQIRAADDSASGLEEMTAHAERVLQLLEIPYRTVALCGGDIGFAAAKTYDLEAWMPGQNCYREISSCSNCGDFQARRLKARLRGGGGKPVLAHTLNGSGVAVGRALIAVMENHQQKDGGIRVPPVLRPYMNGLEKIGG